MIEKERGEHHRLLWGPVGGKERKLSLLAGSETPTWGIPSCNFLRKNRSK